MYLNVMYDGINTLGYYTKVTGYITSSYYINTSSTLIMFTNTPIGNFSNTGSSIVIDGGSISKSVIKNICFSDEYSSTTSISSNFLYYCNSLTSVDLSSMTNVTSIGDYFLSVCGALTSVDLSSMTNVTSIGDYFLRDCNSLTSLDLSSMTNLTSIGSGFLYYCASITSINFSSMTNVTSIGGSFLSYCPSLTSVDLSSMTNLTSIGSALFLGSNVKTLKMGAIVPPLITSLPNTLTSILVPSAAVNAYKAAPG
jgi:hypothetical protein